MDSWKLLLCYISHFLFVLFALFDIWKWMDTRKDWKTKHVGIKGLTPDLMNAGCTSNNLGQITCSLATSKGLVIIYTRWKWQKKACCHRKKCCARWIVQMEIPEHTFRQSLPEGIPGVSLLCTHEQCVKNEKRELEREVGIFNFSLLLPRTIVESKYACLIVGFISYAGSWADKHFIWNLIHS